MPPTKKKLKITFITTINHNVGDDFVREGIEFLLSKTIGYQPKYYYIHKHTPATVRFGFNNLRSLKWSERIERFIPKKIAPDKVSTADIIIQSGAPMYWYHSDNVASYKTEWFQPLVNNRIKEYKKKILNIGVGACQPYYANVESLTCSSKFTNFVNEFYDLCEITIVRDQLSRDLLIHLGKNAKMLPCPSIFSSDNNNIIAKTDQYIVLNYMEGGGHYDINKDIDNDKWRKTFTEFYNKISNKKNIIISSHNREEYNKAKRLLPDAEHFFSEDYKDYIRLYSECKFGIVNRVHAAFQLASNLKPSLIVGADSRAKMSELIGVKSIFVNDTSPELLYSEYLKLSNNSNRKIFKDHMLSLKQRVNNSYVEIIKNSF